MPRLAQTAATLPPLLKITDENKTLDWRLEHNLAFNNILKLVSDITLNKHFDHNLETRVISYASTSGLGPALEQYSKEYGWQ